MWRREPFLVIEIWLNGWFLLTLLIDHLFVITKLLILILGQHHILLLFLNLHTLYLISNILLLKLTLVYLAWHCWVYSSFNVLINVTLNQWFWLVIYSCFPLLLLSNVLMTIEKVFIVICVLYLLHEFSFLVLSVD